MCERVHNIDFERVHNKSCWWWAKYNKIPEIKFVKPRYAKKIRVAPLFTAFVSDERVGEKKKSCSIMVFSTHEIKLKTFTHFWLLSICFKRKFSAACLIKIQYNFFFAWRLACLRRVLCAHELMVLYSLRWQPQIYIYPKQSMIDFIVMIRRKCVYMNRISACLYAKVFAHCTHFPTHTYTHLHQSISNTLAYMCDERR